MKLKPLLSWFIDEEMKTARSGVLSKSGAELAFEPRQYGSRVQGCDTHIFCFQSLFLSFFRVGTMAPFAPSFFPQKGLAPCSV